ncbi:MAG TPA: AMP-binding protein, partial [Beijerinckiaceae bacterium]|nr:AMP-binding protein [Beijerinckiaceae bacterium]
RWPEHIDAKIAALLVDSRWIAFLDAQPPERVAAWQRQRLSQLLGHAAAHSPWWRERVSHLEGRADAVENVPLMSREQYRDSIAAAGGPLQMPAAHGAAHKHSTSGSSGVPVEFFTSALLARLLTAEWYHDDLRQGRDPNSSRAEISTRVPDHAGEHIFVRGNPVFGGGDGFRRKAQRSGIAEHAHWLSRVKPAYLSIPPHMLSAMMEVYESGKLAPPAVAQILTFGETVDTELRRRARAVFGASIRDRYSSEEVGAIAFQCPHSDEHYHVASSNVVVEILDENGRRCAPGVVGRVFVTGLHNWASPAVRYELNDMAAWQPSCACGRHAPVLTQLLGRKRFLVRLPSGDRVAPRIFARQLLPIAPVREHRLVQVSETTLHAELVLDRPITEDERHGIAAVLREIISSELSYEVRQVEKIDWGPTYKRQDVISLI